MGWCSGTDIFDEMVGAILDTKHGIPESVCYEFIRTLASALHTQDWDCESDSKFWNNSIVRRVMHYLDVIDDDECDDDGEPRFVFVVSGIVNGAEQLIGLYRDAELALRDVLQTYIDDTVDVTSYAWRSQAPYDEHWRADSKVVYHLGQLCLYNTKTSCPLMSARFTGFVGFWQPVIAEIKVEVDAK